MRLGIKRIAFLVLAFNIFIGGYLLAADEENRVEVDGDRLSVLAKGITLGELLAAIQEKTGVQFRYDESVAEKKVFLDFEDLSLSEGIKKMVFPLSCAMIYDERDRLRKVVILGRGKDLAMGEPREVENRASKNYQSGSPDAVLSTPRRYSDISSRSKVHPSTKGPLPFPDIPADKKKAEDGPPARQEQVMEGPPLNKTYSIDGPSNAQNGELTGAPDAGSTDPSPPPDSGDSPADGPRLDWKYEMDGPPGWKN